MKIAILAIATLVGFWVVGAILERFQTKTPKPDASSRSSTGPRSAPESETRQVDPIEEACRVLQLTVHSRQTNYALRTVSGCRNITPTRSIVLALSSVSLQRANRRKSIVRLICWPAFTGDETRQRFGRSLDATVAALSPRVDAWHRVCCGRHKDHRRGLC
jgi:hypothetical protein